MRFSRIKRIVERDLEHLVDSRGAFEHQLLLSFPETGCIFKSGGAYKVTYRIVSGGRFFALKVGRGKGEKSAEHLRRDFLYDYAPRSNGTHRNCAKIYWISAGGHFLLQKWGEKKEVPASEENRLKAWGRKYNLIDISGRRNILWFGKSFKIIDVGISKRKAVVQG